jgi:hypothetical protein
LALLQGQVLSKAFVTAVACVMELLDHLSECEVGNI